MRLLQVAQQLGLLPLEFGGREPEPRNPFPLRQQRPESRRDAAFLHRAEQLVHLLGSDEAALAGNAEQERGVSLLRQLEEPGAEHGVVQLLHHALPIGTD